MIQDLKKFINLKNPLCQMAIFLFCFSIISCIDYLYYAPKQTLILIFKYCAILTTGYVLYWFSKFKLGFTAMNPMNTLVSCMIIFLLIHPTAGVLTYILAGLGLWIGKYLFRMNNQPIFNPTAMALTITYFITWLFELIGIAKSDLIISWWGADMNQKFLESIPVLNISVALIAIAGFLYLADKFKKTFYSASFFLAFAVGLIVVGFLKGDSITASFGIIANSLFNSFAFLTLVMLSEPKTSPSFPKQQFLVGGVAGIFLALPLPFLFEPFIVTILVANGVTAIVKNQKILQG